MLELSKPETWIACKLPDMLNMISTIETSFVEKADCANRLASMGATNISQRLRASVVEFDSEAFEDMRKIFSYRVKHERPAVEAMVGNETDRESIRSRIDFMQQYSYPQESISKEYSALAGIKD